MRSHTAAPVFALVLVLSAGGLASSGCTRKELQGPPSSPRATSASSRFGTVPPGKHVAIVYTASVQGSVEPCGCTAEPLGGVARLAALLGEARRAYGERALFLDAGDLLFERSDDVAAVDLCQAEARVDLLLASYARLGVAATALGPLDDVRGPSFRDAFMAKYGIVTLDVEAPRQLQHDAKLQKSMVRKLGDARIGVTAFRCDSQEQVEATQRALIAELARLRLQHLDAVVVLAQAPRALMRQVVAGVPGVDVVVQGRAPGEAPAAPEVLESGAIVVAAGQQAQHAGVLELSLEGRAPDAPLALDDRRAQNERRRQVLAVRMAELEAQIKEAPAGARRDFLAERLAQARSEDGALSSADVSRPLPQPHVVARAVPLPRGAPEEHEASVALAAYVKSVPALVAACEAQASCPAPEPGTRTFVGVATCQRCHAQQHAMWSAQQLQLPGKAADGTPLMRAVGHAQAWQTLVHERKDRDRGCVGCHSVGFAQPGGACKVSDVVDRGLAGVQCESCHGPGSAHAQSASAADIVRSPPESTCRACHRVPHIPTTESFVWSEKMKLILGPGHGEKRRAELGP